MPDPRTRPPDGLAALTARETEVLRMMARGLRSAEIADELGIAVPTVKRHLTTVYRKLAVENRVEATARYFAAVRTPPRAGDPLVQQLERAVRHLASLGLLQVDGARGTAQPVPPHRIRQWARAAKRDGGEEQLHAALEALVRAMRLASADGGDPLADTT